jgi:hypothetical protein
MACCKPISLQDMVIQSTSKRSGVIAVVVDERLSRERGAILTRTINSLRQITKVELLTGSYNEDQMLKKMEENSYDLVLLPWYRYLAWSRVEALWGLTRTSGPTTAGYFCEQLLPYEIEGQAGHSRAIFLDMANLQASEIQTLMKSLHKDLHRSGIKPLVDLDAKIYVENWYGSQGLGGRIDSVLQLSELHDPNWAKRSNSMRICLSALWSLIYEEGPGKGDLSAGGPPKAYFQVAADREVAAFRLCYALPGLNPKEAVSAFWPNPKMPAAPAQLLLKYADFVRVHTIAGTNDIEVVVGFFPSAPAEQAHNQVHTLWIEPIAANLFTEPLYETPSPVSPRLRPLPRAGAPAGNARESGMMKSVTGTPPAAPVEAQDSKVIELQTLLQKRDATIQQMKQGGVSTASPLPPPDAESLLEAFQERYFDAKFQIRQLELEIVALEKKGATPEELVNLKQKMAAVANREQTWVKKLAETIENLKAAGGKK